MVATAELLQLQPATSAVVAPLSQHALPLPPSEPPPTVQFKSQESTRTNTTHPPIFVMDVQSDDKSIHDLPILVEDVSSDDESLDDIISLESSVGSYDDELKAIYDDHDSVTRWINQLIATPPWTLDQNINNISTLDSFDKSSFPAGSTVDMSRPPSPVDLCDFPYLDLDPLARHRMSMYPREVDTRIQPR